MDTNLYEEMYQIEEHHWWFCAKRHILMSLLRKFLGHREASKDPIRVCDIGCGCGMTLIEMNVHGCDGIGIDPSEQAVAYCRSRGVDATQGALPDRLDIPDDSFDAVIMLHVLEHTSDDEASLLEAYRVLKSGGVLICMVPAYSWLWTKRGENFTHHYRRYTRATLEKVLRVVENSQIILLSYIDSFLFPLSVMQRLAWKIFPAQHASGHYALPPLGLNRIFRAVFSAERHFLIRQIHFPFGMSVLGVLRKVPQ